MRITKRQLRRIIREEVEMTDELSKIINKLGVGKEVSKSRLAAAMKAGAGNMSNEENRVVANLFMAILDNPAELPAMIPLLKKAAAETESEKSTSSAS